MKKSVIITAFTIILTGGIVLVGSDLLNQRLIEFGGTKEYLKKTFPRQYQELSKILYEINSDVPGIGDKLELKVFNLILSRKDLAHFSELYRKYEDPKFGIQFYTNNNKWRKAKLIYEGYEHRIQIKSHGRQPDGHRSGRFMSFSIKLEKDEQIHNARRFNLIIRERMLAERLHSTELAKNFGVISQSNKLVSVKINNWENKLYYLENRLDDDFMESSKKSDYHIFGYSYSSTQTKDKSLILNSEKFDTELFQYQFMRTMDELRYPAAHKNALFDSYLAVNQAIYNNDFKIIHHFFNLNYISTLTALRTIAGFIGHGSMKGNLYVFYNMANGKFYPAITRDHIKSNINLKLFSTPEKQLGTWHDGEKSHPLPLWKNLARNDLIRQEKYNLIYKIITEQGKDLTKQHREFIKNKNQLHYRGWANEFMKSFELLPDKSIIKNNFKTLKLYIEKSNPEITADIRNGTLQIEIIPHSMSALRMNKLILQHPSAVKAEMKKLNYYLFTYIDGKLDNSFERRGSFLHDENGINLTNLISDLTFSTALDKDLEPIQRKYIFIFDSEEFTGLGITKNNTIFEVYNNVTEQEVTNGNIIIGKNKLTNIYHDMKELQLSDKHNTKNSSFLNKFNHIDMTINNQEELIIHTGNYDLYDDFILPIGLKLVIEAGTTLRLGHGVVIFGRRGLDVRGTLEQPVSITAKNPEEPFGTVGIIGDSTVISNISHLKLSNGSESWIEGIFFSGALSLHYNAGVNISNSLIYDNHSDDAINIKYSSNVRVLNTIFRNNFADQIDLDYCSGEVFNSKFLYTKLGTQNGDGLDISGSNIVVRNSIFDGFLDKGLSIGEESNVFLYKNKVKNNTNGIAVKDLSNAYLIKNNFNSNIVDINVYQKKNIFGGGNIFMKSSEAITNSDKINLDEKSSLKFFPSNYNVISFPTKDSVPNIKEVFDDLKNVSFTE